MLRSHHYVVDTGVAAVMYALILLGPMLGPHDRFGYLRPATVIFGTIVCAALVFRRRWPLTVLAITTLGGLGDVLVLRAVDGVIGATMLAVFTVSAYTDRRVSLPTVFGCVLMLGVVSLVLDHPVPPQPGNLTVLGLGAFAIAAGEATRSRQAHLIEMEERASRAERTREQEARRRVTEERLRIARDLHDLVGHHIALINVQAGAASHLLDQQPEQAKEALVHIRAACRSALDELAGTIGLLRQPDDPRPPTEPSVGLARLGELTDSFGASGLRVERFVEGAARSVPAAVDLTAYRVIQESLTNVRKHARTTAATVRLCYAVDSLSITVEDNGVGRPRESTVDGGHGIVGMAERAAALGGTMHAGPRPDGGFQVRVILPAVDAVAAS
jgi:signal transduction histidine kinase